MVMVMKKSALPARSYVWLGCALAALVVVTAAPQSALGADRMVICEAFMSPT